MSLKINRNIIIFIGALVLVVGLLIFQQYGSEEIVKPRVPLITKEKHIRYTFTIKNKSADFLKDVEIQTFVPVKKTGLQKMLGLKSTTEYEMVSDELGNQVMRFNVTLPPYGTKIVTNDVDLEFRNIPDAETLTDGETFLIEEKYIELGFPPLVDLAKKVSGVDANDTAKKAFDWVVANIKESNYIAKDRGAKYAFNKLSGDCTEMSYIYIVLLRLNNIPARLIGGFKVEDRLVLKGKRYHNWVEYHDGTTWNIVDPQEKIFRDDQMQYLAFRIISHTEAYPMSNSSRFLAFDKRMEVQLN